MVYGSQKSVISASIAKTAVAKTGIVRVAMNAKIMSVYQSRARIVRIA
jgi:hypothetical protein